MRIDDDVRYKAGSGSGHILGIEDHPASPLLTVTRRELVANLWNPVLAHTHLCKGVAFPIPVLKYAINPPSFIITHRPGYVTKPLGAGGNHHASGDAERHVFPDKNVVGVHIGVLWHEATLIQLRIVRVLHLFRHGRVGAHESLLFAGRLILPLLILVGAVEDGAEEATIERAPIDHDGILLVVARVCTNRHHDILAGRHRLCTIEATHEWRDKGDLRIAEEMGERVESIAEVERVHPHRLFAHRRLIGVTGRLIVIREGNVARQSSERRTRMNLCMGV